MTETVFERFDPRADRCFLSNVFSLETIASGLRWAEGPVWFADRRCLLWSDIPSNRIHYWLEDGVSGIYRQPSNFANGNTHDGAGRLVSCEHQTRRVTRTEYDGSITVIADRFEGKRLNSPNDVVVKRDGSVWFSDPDYGIMNDYEGGRGVSDLGACNVYRADPATGAVTLAASGYCKPNGLAFSADERLLYVADSGGSHVPGGPKKIFVHDVQDDGRLGPARVFADLGDDVPDGFRLDDAGNVWTSAGKAVCVFAPDGTLIGRINVPEIVANVTFGGACRHRLFITASSSVYAVYTAARGLR